MSGSFVRLPGTRRFIARLRAEGPDMALQDAATQRALMVISGTYLCLEGLQFRAPHDEALAYPARTRVFVIGGAEHRTVRLQDIGLAAMRNRLAGLNRQEKGRVGNGGTERPVHPAFRSPDDDTPGGDCAESV
jgi:hypothetical protein